MYTHMNPIRSIARHPFKAFFSVIVLGGGVVLAAPKFGYEILPPPVTRQIYAEMGNLGPRFQQAKGFLTEKYAAYFHQHHEEQHHEPHKVVATSPKQEDVIVTEEYVCQIHSQRHIEIRALEGGYLEEIVVKEGQAVKKGDLMFKIVPTLYQAKLDAEKAEAQLAQLEYNYTKKLSDDKVVSTNELALLQAKLTKANAKAQLAQAELNFTYVRAPFDGIVDRLQEQLGSLVKEGDILTTLSDNSTMWVYFNVPEARYLEYMAGLDHHTKDQPIELRLANGATFQHVGKIGAIEAKFNNETGNIPFRADFPNPDGLLRHGQTGNVLLRRPLKQATVIPQRAAFEILDKRFVYVIDKDDVVHQREIKVQHEADDIYVIQKGLNVGERIVLEGTRQVRDGEKVEFEFHKPQDVLAQLKNKAE